MNEKREYPLSAGRWNIVEQLGLPDEGMTELHLELTPPSNLEISYRTKREPEILHSHRTLVTNEFTRQLNDALGFREGEKITGVTINAIESLGIVTVEIHKLADDRIEKLDWSQFKIEANHEPDEKPDDSPPIYGMRWA